MGRKIIAVDFDGTLCINQDVVNWPYLGQPNKELVENLRLYRMRDTSLSCGLAEKENCWNRQ